MKARRGFTILEMLSVVMIIGVMVGLLLPSVQALRERARQISCSNNLMQAGLGVSAYHASFAQLPVQLSGTDGSTKPGADNDRRLSILVALLPFLGHGSTIDEMNSPLPWDPYQLDYESMTMMGMDYEDIGEATADEEAEFWAVGGPEPYRKGYQVWNFEVPEFRCPSDPGMGSPAYGRTNYAACLGDGLVAMDTGPMKEVQGVFVWDKQRAAQTEAAMRGAFVPRLVTRLDDISDGRAYTVLLGEIATDLGDRGIITSAAIGPSEGVLRDRPAWAYEVGLLEPDRPRIWKATTNLISDANANAARGMRWADGAPLFTAFNTILPPNHALVLSGKREDGSGVLPPSSRHLGGVNVCMADGSIRFVTDSIDAGNRETATPYLGSANAPGGKSVYGVWGAMGTRASEELVFASNAL